GFVALEVLERAKVVSKLVTRCDVVDPIAQLDDIARLEPRQLDVERTHGGVHRDRRIVCGADAGIDCLIDAAVRTEDAGAPQLNTLPISVELEEVLATQGRGRTNQRLKDDLL